MKRSRDITTTADSAEIKKERSEFKSTLKVACANSFDPNDQKKYCRISHLPSSEEWILCGLNDDQIKRVQINGTCTDLTVDHENARKHAGLSHLRCHKTNDDIFYSSSAKDESILTWDLRTNPNKSSQKFYIDGNQKIGDDYILKSQPILTFDIDNDESTLCAGTELVSNDTYLLFWDTRKPGGTTLRAFSDVHSDDVTSIKFNPYLNNSLSTGSTDGLINIFDFNESTAEDESIMYSFNTLSSVEDLIWMNKAELLSLTHTNHLLTFNAETGDELKEFTRSDIAQIMNLDDSDSIQLNSCHSMKLTTGEETIGIFVSASSEKIDSAAILAFEGQKLKPQSLFTNREKCQVQSAQFISKSDKWITFMEDGLIQIWDKENSA